MAKIFIRQRKFSYIKTPEMISPQVRGYEQVWLDGIGEETYWDNQGVHRQRISSESQINPLMKDWFDWVETPIYGDSFERLGEQPKSRKVKIVSDRSRQRKIIAGVKNWWQKTANQTSKLTRRLKSAWQAAYKELRSP